MDNFLRSAFARLPKLRYIAVAQLNAKHLKETWSKDYAGNRAPWSWWKAVRDGRGTLLEIREIPAWEGERVREYVREADAEGMERFDGGCNCSCSRARI